MGGKGGSNTSQDLSLSIAQQQAALAREIRQESAPLRRLVFEELQAALEGRPVQVQTGTERVRTGTVPSNIQTLLRGTAGDPIFKTRPIFEERPGLFTQQTSLGLQDVAQQFGAARRNILQGGSRGGQLQSALNNLELARAGTAAGVRANNLATAFNAAQAIGTGQTALAFQGLAGANMGFGRAGALQAQSEALRFQQQLALGQGLGQMAGKGLSAGLQAAVK